MIIITGGTHGIGEAAAAACLREGHQVLITGRDAAAGQAALADLPEAVFLRANASVEEDCRATVALALVLGKGRIKGLVNNAGIGERHVFRDTTVADWDRIQSVNVRSTYLMTRLALDGLIAAGGGAVVNVASIAGQVGEEGLAIYVASKAAIIGLTQALALELGHLIRFNAVCPGQIGTRMMQAVRDDDRRRQTMELRIPAGRMGRPQEVGDVITWLLSDRARYVNGTTITVDGGETAGLRTPRQLPPDPRL